MTKDSKESIYISDTQLWQIVAFILIHYICIIYPLYMHYINKRCIYNYPQTVIQWNTTHPSTKKADTSIYVDR